MKNVVCLLHRNYNGSIAPDLSCKTCCSRYVAVIRSEVAQKQNQAEKSLSHQRRDEIRNAAVASQGRLPINPSFI